MQHGRFAAPRAPVHGAVRFSPVPLPALDARVSASAVRLVVRVCARIVLRRNFWPAAICRQTRVSIRLSR